MQEARLLGRSFAGMGFIDRRRRRWRAVGGIGSSLLSTRARLEVGAVGRSIWIWPLLGSGCRDLVSSLGVEFKYGPEEMSNIVGSCELLCALERNPRRKRGRASVL